MIDWKSKLTSRKFWAAICNFAAMLILFFKGTEETAAQITALIMAGGGVIAFIIGEGLIDAASAKSAVTYNNGWDDAMYSVKQETEKQEAETNE